MVDDRSTRRAARRWEPLEYVTGALVAAGVHVQRQVHRGNLVAAVVAVAVLVVVLGVATLAAVAAVLVGLVRLVDHGHRRRLAARDAAERRAARHRAREVRQLQHAAPQWAAWAAANGMPHTARAWEMVADDAPEHDETTSATRVSRAHGARR